MPLLARICLETINADWLTPAVPSPGYIESPHNHKPSKGVLLDNPNNPNISGFCPRPPTIPFGLFVHLSKDLGVDNSLCNQSSEAILNFSSKALEILFKYWFFLKMYWSFSKSNQSWVLAKILAINVISPKGALPSPSSLYYIKNEPNSSQINW